MRIWIPFYTFLLSLLWKFSWFLGLGLHKALLYAELLPVEVSGKTCDRQAGGLVSGRFMELLPGFGHYILLVHGGFAVCRPKLGLDGHPQTFRKWLVEQKTNRI